MEGSHLPTLRFLPHQVKVDIFIFTFFPDTVMLPAPSRFPGLFDLGLKK